VDFTVVTGYRELFLMVIGICVIAMTFTGIDRRGNGLAKMPTTPGVSASPLGRLGDSQPSQVRDAMTYSGALEQVGSARVVQPGRSGGGSPHGVPSS
jgi:hypothetical protein